jgi:hypothetical protein
MGKRLHKSGRIMKGSAMSDDLVALLRIRAGDTRETSPATMELAADRIEALQAALAQAEARERETLAVLQTAHEGEEAAQDTIRRLMNELQAHKDALAQATGGQHHD